MFHLTGNVILIFNELSYLGKFEMRLLVYLSFLVLFTSVHSVRYIFLKSEQINDVQCTAQCRNNVHN